MFVKRVINEVRYCGKMLDWALKNPNSNLRRNVLDKVYSEYTVLELQKIASGEFKYLPSPKKTPLTGRGILNKIAHDHFCTHLRSAEKAPSKAEIVEKEISPYASSDAERENLKEGIKKLINLGLLRQETFNKFFKGAVDGKLSCVSLTPRGEKVLYFKRNA